MSPQQLLWQRWGDPAHPAEWDGREGNGGKCSQRFWEYLWVLNHIGEPSSILDVGGGQNTFFKDLLKDDVFFVVVDPLAPTSASGDSHGMTVEQYAATKRLSFKCVTCISVLEHVTDKDAFCAALDSFPCPIVMTLELGEGCVTMPQLYQCLRQFMNHHVTVMEACPVVADNSYGGRWRPLGLVLEPNTTL